MPLSRDVLLRLGRFVLLVEGIALASAAILGGIHAMATRSPFFDSFFLMVFLIFLLLIGAGVLSGPGLFLSRPRLAPIGPAGMNRWRQWISTPQPVRDREFVELLMYVGLAFLLLVIATGINAFVGP